MSDIANILRDPLWQFIGVIIAIVSIAIAIFFSLRQRNRKAVSYRILSSTPVLRVSEGVEGKMKMLYENQEVQNVQLLVINLANTGNVPIVESDYSLPVQVSFGNGRILTVEIMERTPKELDVNPIIEENTIVINKALLNQGDSFSFRTLVADFQEIIKLTGRIAGVKEITKQVDPPYGRNAVIGMVMLYAGFVGYSTFLTIIQNDLLSTLFIIITVIGAIIMAWFTVRQFLYLRKTRKKRK